MFQEYTKRFRFNFEHTEIKDQNTTTSDILKLIKKMVPSETLILLDEHGKDNTTIEFSNFLAKISSNNQTPIFLIGGHNGHHPDVKKCANHVLSLGKMTLPHLLARVILVEQLYRCQQIFANHPYHRV